MSDAIYRRAIERYGYKNQVRMLQEECAEVIVAASHWLRGRDREALIDELADVEILIEQMRVVFGDEPIDTAKRAKLERLAARLGGSDER